jgi:hypothetical protein
MVAPKSARIDLLGPFGRNQTNKTTHSLAHGTVAQLQSGEYSRTHTNSLCMHKPKKAKMSIYEVQYYPYDLEHRAPPAGQWENSAPECYIQFGWVGLGCSAECCCCSFCWPVINTIQQYSSEYRSGTLIESGKLRATRKAMHCSIEHSTVCTVYGEPNSRMIEVERQKGQTDKTH